MAWTDPRTWTDGELVTAAIMNPHIRDNFNALPHLVVRKSADETVNNSTTLQNDDALLMALGATETWWVEFDVIYSSSTVADIKIAFTIPGGASMALSAMWMSSVPTAGISNWLVSGTATDLQGRAENLVVPIKGFVATAGTAGNITMQWAQNALEATNTIVRANSTLWATKIA